VTEFIPSIGPKAGGSRLTVRGHNLNTGADVRVMFDNVSCNVEQLVCSRNIYLSYDSS